jgi:Tol biopolymer transport system component
VRDTAEGARLYVVSALGGTARKVSEFTAGGQIGWSPDDRYLLSGRSQGPDRGIYAVPVAGGAAQRVVAGPPSGGSRGVGLTPDGRRLAYAACRTVSDYGYLDCDADLVQLDRSLKPAGPPQRLTTMPSLGGFTWVRGGNALVFFGDPSGNGEARLFRVDVASHKVETIDAAGITVGIPTTTRANDRLVFVRFEIDDDILAATSGHRATTLLSSSAYDGMPAYSADGARLAFTSGRAGPREIWVSDADGSNPRQLTHGPASLQQAPRWSPDGRVVAFESQGSDGHMHVWTLGTDGGRLRRLTGGPGDEGSPTWSHDGRFVYFGANHGQGYDIWRVAAAGGGTPERITKGGSGYVAFESPDGKSILYQEKTTSSPLLRTPVSGGTPRVVVPCASADVFTWHPAGIYYVPCGVEQPAPVHRLVPDTGRDVVAARLEDLDMGGQADLAVSPDGQTILYVSTGNIARGGDLWMIDHFK